MNAYDGSDRVKFIDNILSGMREHSIKRIIVVGGIGALQASEDLKVYQTPNFPPMYVELSKAHERVLDALIASGSEFTFVGPLFIQEGRPSGNYQVQAKYPPGGTTISSGDLADFIIKEIDESKFVREKVGISSG